jgi:hypothetical protein
MSKVEMLPGATVPSVRLTDKRFAYTPAHRTCIADRFKRIAQERERAAFENVTQMRRK